MQEEQNVESILDSMINGDYKAPAEEIDKEDTDQQEEVETEEQPETVDADQENEASDDDMEDEEEDTLVEDEGLEEEAENSESTDDVEDEEQADDKEGTEPEDEDDGQDSETTDTIDYRKQYEELLEQSKVAQDFYDKVTNAEFKVNGKLVKGFKDPDKIIQSQQLSGGLTQKLAGTKKFKPYINPLKERGMLDDPEKFNLAMNIIDGDKEALKHHIKTLGIDPVMDFDMESEVQYSNKNTLASETQLALDEALEMAESNGVSDKFSKVLAKEWDQSSFEELVGNSRAREDLVTHLSDGTYDIVQDRIDELARTDVNGTFGALNSIAKYRTAMITLIEERRQQEATETANNEAHTKDEQGVAEADKAEKIKAEKAKIAKARQEAEYKAELEKKNKAVAEKRKKATAASKKKAKASTKKKPDPLSLSGQDMSKYLDSLIAKG